ncbi:M4 family metallopeptidase [Dermacoccaceae bacterium W4C1]
MTRCCTIVPPHLLRLLAQAPEPQVARAAARSLAIGDAVVSRREARAARTGPRPSDVGGVGLIPTDLRRRSLPGSPRGGATRMGASEPVGAAAAAASLTPQRSIHDAQRGTDLPGVLARAEGDQPVSDESVNEAYDGLGDTFSLFAQVYGRNSLDARGLPLVATVHYDQNFDNAYWDGEQMVFGDGDGVYFNSFTDSVDVIGHELAHGFTQYTAGFTYVGQSGALNESVSDVFGSLVKQRVLGQQAQDADWLIGENLFTAAVTGVALRSMKAPGTAYDDTRLGKDPQPATMDHYQDLPHDEANDNGGVHINSGIPNHAFYLAAVAIGGHAWEKAGQVWYDVMTQGGLPKDVDFAGFATATITLAQQRFGDGSAEQQAIREAWSQVKVL